MEWYRERLAGTPLSWQRQPPWARSNWQSLAVRLPQGQSQQDWMQRLLDGGVSSRRGIMCAHREAAYPPGSWRGASLLESERAQDEVILLPLFHDLSQDQMEKVAEASFPLAAINSPALFSMRPFTYLLSSNKQDDMSARKVIVTGQKEATAERAVPAPGPAKPKPEAPASAPAPTPAVPAKQPEPQSPPIKKETPAQTAAPAPGN